MSRRPLRRRRRVGNVRAARQFLVGCNEILGVAMSAIERNKVTRRLHARTIDPTGVDRIAQRQLPITEVVFARIAQGSEPLREPDFEILHAPQRLFRRRHAEARRRTEIGQVTKDVRMTIDHARHDKGIGKIDHAHARGRLVANALDAMVLDRDENIVLDLSGFNVEQSTGFDRDRRRRRRGKGRRRWRRSLGM